MGQKIRSSISFNKLNDFAVSRGVKNAVFSAKADGKKYVSLSKLVDAGIVYFNEKTGDYSLNFTVLETPNSQYDSHSITVSAKNADDTWANSFVGNGKCDTPTTTRSSTSSPAPPSAAPVPTDDLPF